MNSSASQHNAEPSAGTRARAAVAWVSLAVLLAAAGCGLGGSGNGDAPPPGQMEVLSVVPVETAPPPPLIPAAAFETWWAGAPVPASEVFVLPQKTSELSRAKGNAADGELAIRQTWTSKDNVWLPEVRFGAQVDGLKPFTEYKLTGAALAEEDASATLEVYGVTGKEESFWQIALKWIEIAPANEWQDFEGTFATGEVTTVRITTACYGDASKESPNTVLWDNWQLAVVGPAEWPDPEATEDNLIANGSFEIWAPGEPAPRGAFIAPNAGLAHSFIRPMLVTHRDGKAGIEQSWEASDRKDPLGELFGVEAPVDPNTSYEFSMAAHMTKTASISVHAYGVKKNGGFETLADPLFEVPVQGGWKQYKGKFDSGESTEVRIVVRGPTQEDGFPNRALYDDWRLTPAGK